MTGVRQEEVHDRSPRLPPATTLEDVSQRARSESRWARASIVLLLPVIVAAAASLFDDLDFALVARALARDEDAVDPARILALDARANTLLMFPLLASIPFATAFLVWLHRSVANARWSGGDRWMTFTPGGAVSAFFIPLRNLVRPFQALDELTRASDPADVEALPRTVVETAGYREPALGPEAPPPTLARPPLGAWWATWIGAHLVGFVGSQMAHSVALDVAATGGWVLVTSDALEMVAAVCVGLVIHRVALRREDVFRRLGAPLSPASPAGSASDGAFHG